MAGEASRANGKKGGRPRKHMRADPPETPAKPKGKWALSRREELFIHNLIAFPEKSQGQCYIDAGFRAKNADTASTNASRLLGKDRMARALAAAREHLASRNMVTQDRVLKELGSIGFFDIRKLFATRDGAKLTPEQLYDQCRNHDWTHPWAQLSPAEQASWKAAADVVQPAGGGYYLKNPDQLDDETAAAIGSIEVSTKSLGDGEVEYIHKLKPNDKLGALRTIAQTLGMLGKDGAGSGAGGPLEIAWES